MVAYLSSLEAGRRYRLRRDFEVRRLETGTMVALLQEGSIVRIREVDTEAGRVYVEGCDVPVPMDALARAVDPVA